MVTNRTIAYVVGMATVLAVPFFLSWLNSTNPLLDSPVPWLWLHVKFEEGYLNVTMTNNDNRDYIISEVILCRERTILAGKLVREPISTGEQISICINFNWTSHVRYDIIVRTREGKSILVGIYAP